MGVFIVASHAVSVDEVVTLSEAPQVLAIPPGLRFLQQSPLPVSAVRAFEWHAAPGALERLSPPWEDVRVISRTGGIADGGMVTLSVPTGPIRQTWVAHHDRCVWGHEFRDVQIKGPFAKFEHTHRFVPTSPHGCELQDDIHFLPPGGALGRWLGSGFIENKLRTMFDYRHGVTTADLDQWRILHDSGFQLQNILVSGATGLVASQLIPLFTTQGHRVARLLRKPSTSAFPSGLPDVLWNSETGEISQGELRGVTAVVHLAGENIAGARWTPEVKQRIRDSRVVGTRKLCERLAAMPQPPEVLVCASAIGFYGDRGVEPLTEDSSPGAGFLPEVCQEWEAACEPARKAGIRVVNLRIGVVLSPQGGALQKLLLPFSMGAGGVVGDGRQVWSWISIDDLCGSILHAIATRTLHGPVNATSPQPSTNAEFTRTLAKVLHRPAFIPVPAFAARLALGEMANDLLFASSLVQPVRLLESGYQFRTPELEVALRHLLGRPASAARS